MLSLVFDTETTGFFQSTKPLDHPSQARVVQLGAMLVDGPKIHAVLSLIIKQEIESSAGALAIHEITKERTNAVGVDSQTACAMLSKLSKMADRFVAHNGVFDRNMMNVELFGIEKSFDDLPIPVTCTMETTTSLMELPPYRRGAYKWPKLIEAYKHYVDPKGFEGAHDALVDVRACHALMVALESRGHTLTEV